MKRELCFVTIFSVSMMVASGALAQWSSDPTQNLVLADAKNSNQVQPKLRPLADSSWFVSWFANASTGYDVHLQHLAPNGTERLAHPGVRIAKLSLAWTEDYGLDIDAEGNALLAFQDDRRADEQVQITAAKINTSGVSQWGLNGIAVSADTGSSHSPRIVATSDGAAVVAWTNDEGVALQRLDSEGRLSWGGNDGTGVTLSEPGFDYALADIQAADDGAVIVTFVRSAGYVSEKHLYINKIAADGQLMWGASHIAVFDGGSLQFGSFPNFISDGKGGAVLAWYSTTPSLQVHAQHILATGVEAFLHNGAVGSTNTKQARVSPELSYDTESNETYLVWTELNDPIKQDQQGVFAQKFDATGARRWGDSGLMLTSLTSNAIFSLQGVATDEGIFAFWITAGLSQEGTIQGIKLGREGETLCERFPISSVPSRKSGLETRIAPSGLIAMAWQDQAVGQSNSDIHMQNVNRDCTLGVPGSLRR